MAVFTAFYPRVSPRTHGSHNKNAKTPRRAATAPSPSSAKKTHSAAITVAEVVHSRHATGYHIQLNKPLPDPPALEMAHSEAVSSPNDDPATAEFEGDIKVTDDIPSRSTLDKVAELPVLNVDGKRLPFRCLYEGINGEKKTQKVMVIFIRHFFCGNCQEYLRTLSASLPSPTELLQLPTPTSIVIVGCGSPTLIPMYVEATSCPFPIYADPTKRLYSLLGMVRTLSLGSTDPDYIHQTILSGMVKSIVQGLGRMGKGDVFKAGDMRQVGGEFMFEKGKVTWCHRMRNTRDHAEAHEMKRVLGLGDNGDDRPPPKRRWTTNLTRLGSTRRPSWNDRKLSVGGRRKGSQSSSSSGSPKRANTMVNVSEDGKGTMNAGGNQDEEPLLARIISGEVTKDPDGL